MFTEKRTGSIGGKKEGLNKEIILHHWRRFMSCHFHCLNEVIFPQHDITETSPSRWQIDVSCVFDELLSVRHGSFLALSESGARSRAVPLPLATIVGAITWQARSTLLSLFLIASCIRHEKAV